MEGSDHAQEGDFVGQGTEEVVETTKAFSVRRRRHNKKSAARSGSGRGIIATQPPTKQMLGIRVTSGTDEKVGDTRWFRDSCAMLGESEGARVQHSGLTVRDLSVYTTFIHSRYSRDEKTKYFGFQTKEKCT